MRTCVACRRQRHQAELVRVARASDGRVLVDASGAIDGRGAYLCPETGCLGAASARSKLARALRTRIPEDITDRLTQYERIGSSGATAEATQTTHGGTHGA